MNCKKALARLSAYQDGELPAPAAAELERHLLECAGCRFEWQDMQALVAGLRRLTSPEPRSGFSSRVMAALRDRPEKRRLWLPSLAYSLALPLVFIGGFLLAVSGNGQRPAAAIPDTAATYSNVLAGNQGLGLLAVHDLTMELYGGGSDEN